MHSPSIQGVSAIVSAVAWCACAAPVQAAPPTPQEVRDTVSAMRQSMNGLRVEADISSRGYDADEMANLIDIYTSSVWESRDGCFRTVTSRYSTPRRQGGNPFQTTAELFDGTDSHRAFPQAFNGLPIVRVSPGLDSVLFQSEGYFHYFAMVWSDIQRPLDDAMDLDGITATVDPQPVDVRGISTWHLTLRKNIDDNDDFAAWITDFWVAPTMGMLPVRTRISWVLTDGSLSLLNGRNAYDFEEVRPGLFLPRTVIITDPFDPNPATYKRIDVTSFGQSRSTEDLVGGIFSGDRYVIDDRYNQKYELRDGVRSKVTTISSANTLDGKLENVIAEDNAVREVSLLTPPTAATTSCAMGPAAWWSIPGVAGLGILLCTARIGRSRA